MVCLSVRSRSKRKLLSPSSGGREPKRQKREETGAKTNPRTKGTSPTVPSSDRKLRSSNKEPNQPNRDEPGVDAKLPTKDASSKPPASNGEPSSSNKEPNQQKGEDHGTDTKPNPQRLARITNMLNSFFRTAFSEENAGDTCTLCEQKPPASGEEWCILPCGHKFGHRCLRMFFLYPSFRACPTCVAPAFRTCGHPLAPAMLSGIDELHGLGLMRALKRAALLLDERTRSVCGYCEKRPGDDEAAFLLLDLLYGKGEEPEHRLRMYRMEPEWQEWWGRETDEIPLTVKSEKDLMRRFKFRWAWARLRG